MRRAAVLLTAIALLAAAPAAHGQNDPFGPLPQPAPTQTPVPVPDGDDDIDFTRTQLLLLALAVIGGFAAVIWFITRDARRSLPERDRERLERQERGTPSERRQAGAQAKQRARRKAKAQRAARRRNR